MTENEDNSDEEIVDTLKKSGKELLQGVAKGGALFSKRVAEGVFNAQIAQSNEDTTGKKISIVSQELGKAIVKGVMEGANETFVGVKASLEHLSKIKPKDTSEKTDEE
ncbi:MAG: hypothetical protein OEY49_01570 [Candidatus Heimdallarchaeota archaeon]|nr:hypothetical protein [Candidatus Heimdallarchaeota archaeon]